MKKAVLELGGSDPFVVAPDADLEATAKDAVIGRCVNSGQTCTSSKRFIVVEELYEAFVEKFAAGMSSVPFGDPQDEATVVGPPYALVPETRATTCRIRMPLTPSWPRGRARAPRPGRPA